MGKDPSAVVLVMALAFCAFCPFFARCDETELNIKKGIASLSNVLVKYHAEFDRKVKFVELQEAVDVIGKAMLNYNGKAKEKLPQIRSLNSEARLTYQNCVGPVFEWCISANKTFDIFIDKIGDSNLSETNRNIMWNMVAVALELGLEKTGKSLELLTNVQHRTAELKNAFEEILHDVHDDFGPGGFYGKDKAELEERINNKAVLVKTRIVLFVGTLFDAIGVLVFGPIGLSLGFPAAFASFGITDLVHWQQMEPYQEQVELIEHFFTDLTQKIKNATEKVKEMESDLKEDKTNLQKLRRVIAGPNNKKEILLSDMALRRVQFIPNIQNLKDSCAEYVKWLGHDAPFYQKISSRTRRSASPFYESEPSPA
ncbi:uncharacterized protein [Drosophila bipectinata]|uniref:uncharacterized protein n=1 Tax=Drosophila bipectinata TaxID=42026 RepID=UPI001C88F6E7|nr:uncharacterized protein LOC122321044 [Drosophila bipectinata]